MYSPAHLLLTSADSLTADLVFLFAVSNVMVSNSDITLRLAVISQEPGQQSASGSFKKAVTIQQAK
jgi:hypothetical protein